jgi:hypothetical protein
MFYISHLQVESLVSHRDKVPKEMWGEAMEIAMALGQRMTTAHDDDEEEEEGGRGQMTRSDALFSMVWSPEEMAVSR